LHCKFGLIYIVSKSDTIFNCLFDKLKQNWTNITVITHNTSLYNLTMKAVIFKNSSLIATHVTDQKQQEFLYSPLSRTQCI